jgi:hypothetical protein
MGAVDDDSKSATERDGEAVRLTDVQRRRLLARASPARQARVQAAPTRKVADRRLRKGGDDGR